MSDAWEAEGGCERSMCPLPEIVVCVCTYKRPVGLQRLLVALDGQETQGQFVFAVSIVDNDVAESGRQVAESWRSSSHVASDYCVVPEQNIALARNVSVSQRRGDFVAFVDDDEVPGRDWLCLMYDTLTQTGADGVLGPVKPRFESTPPRWVLRSGLFERPTLATGYRIRDWRRETRTGNALIRREVLDGSDGPFDTTLFSGGEDQDFFRRAMDRGKVFVWCSEAVVYETVPIERTRLSFQIRRALLGGGAALAISSNRRYEVMKSIAALAAYAVLLPIVWIAGWRFVLRCLVGGANHLGKVLASCGIKVVKERYVLQ
jgi:succinoglycan biosynthesis protein ExoM